MRGPERGQTATTQRTRVVMTRAVVSTMTLPYLLLELKQRPRPRPLPLPPLPSLVLDMWKIWMAKRNLRRCSVSLGAAQEQASPAHLCQRGYLHQTVGGRLRA